MILDCREIANDIITSLANEEPANLHIIMIGDDPASEVYVRNKVRVADKCGMEIHIDKFSNDVSEEDIINHINTLNTNVDVDGIMVQLPIDKKFNAQRIVDTIDPIKDADGLTTVNAGKLWIGDECIKPCTPSGIMYLLEHENVNLEGKHVVIIGRSNLVGKPIAKMLLDKNCTVTMCHSRTKNLPAIASQADVLIVAIGKAEFIDSKYIKDGAIVIDVGINVISSEDEKRKIVGDVNLNECKDKCSIITPVPKGIGVLTTAMLAKNVYYIRKLRKKYHGVQ